VSDYQIGKGGETGGGESGAPLCTHNFIAGITAEVKNDQWVTRSGSWGDEQTSSPTLNKDLKLSKKLARLLHQLEDKEMKEEQCEAFVAIFATVLHHLG
jgi:hypothetical protein